MTDLEIRAFGASLEIRAGGDGREVTGQVVPYGVDTPILAGDGSVRFIERLTPESFQRRGGHLYWNHPTFAPHDPMSVPVSTPGDFRDNGRSGLFAQWRVLSGPLGDGLLDAIKSGKSAALSPGFYPSADDVWSADRSHVERRNAILEHVAAVPQGAYPESKVFQIRAGKQPYGDVEYADPGYQDDGVKRYPIDTEAHVRAAWSYINQADNAGKYSSEHLAAVKGRIKAAAKRFGIEIAEASTESRRRDDHQRLVEVRRQVPGLAPGFAASEAAAKVAAWEHRETFWLRQEHRGRLEHLEARR